MANYTGAGGADIKSSSYFDGELLIDDQHFIKRFRIVKDNDIPTDILIGNEFLFDVCLTMEKGSITVKRIENETEKEDNKLWCMAITQKDEISDLPKDIEKIVDSNVSMKIQLTDENPVFEPLRRQPYAHREVVKNQIKEWIKDGIVKPGNSPYACNVLVTKKKDDSNRVCIDYRPVNKKLIRDRYPAPNIDDILESLKDAKVFSKIDLNNVFFHIPIEEESQKYLAFVTYSGQYVPL